MKKLLSLKGILLIGGLMAMPLSANAADSAYDKLDKGPKIGTAIPHPLKTVDQRGKPQDFTSLKGERGLILLFARSLDW